MNPVMLQTNDGDMGRPPLHYAASCMGYSKEFPIGVTSTNRHIQEIFPIHFILSKYPIACTITDVYNQLPLHIDSERLFNQNLCKEVDTT
jgi:hypothetical protein